jgi:hypothetical protein
MTDIPCVCDAKGAFVGVMALTGPGPNYNQVVHSFGGTPYTFVVNGYPDGGVDRNTGPFWYPTADCAGPAYVQDAAAIPTGLVDVDINVWAAQRPLRQITPQSYCWPSASAQRCDVSYQQGGACHPYASGGYSLWAGVAQLVDAASAKSWVAPFGQCKPHR